MVDNQQRDSLDLRSRIESLQQVGRRRDRRSAVQAEHHAGRPQVRRRSRQRRQQRDGIRGQGSEWSADRDWIQNRLKQEIVNQGLSVEKGDEVEAQRDPQVRAAVAKLSR